jgi:putative tryptophan/tyrosine transport system substrate-binding protein
MMEAADPVGSGFVTSLARPGGNITGMSTIMPELAGKRLELLKEIIPKLSRVAFLAHSGGAAHKLFVKEAQEATERFGMKFQPLIIAAPQEIEGAFSAMSHPKTGGLFRFNISGKNRRLSQKTFSAGADPLKDRPFRIEKI